jgi:hypothetical protein
MKHQSKLEQVKWLLTDLCEQGGYCSALRELEGFEVMVDEGAEAFADAVLTTEGLKPEKHKDIRRDVLAVVSERFQQWSDEDSEEHAPDRELI